jgi:DNA replication and repair protein RecF
MALQRLSIENFRCIQSAELEFDGHCNLICGANGSGKTSLLEAIFFLGRARSFRTPHSDALVRQGSERLITTGWLARPHRPEVLGLAYGRGGLEARHDGDAVSGIAELARLFPVQAIDPEIHRLIEEGPQQRRRYLDWGVFHVEPRYVESWQRFQRALRQRNASLRSKAAAAVTRAWDPELIEAGMRVAEARARYLAQLRPHVLATGERLLGLTIDLNLTQGWASERSFTEALERSWARDVERGLTHVGPHRADLQVRVQDQPAREHVSRGQQKLVASSMLLGQLRCNAERGSATTALLVDDPAAELDGTSLHKLLDEVLALPLQLYVTALESTNAALERLESPARFHVEHGVLTRLV